ncbi:hypothetical protein BH10PLA1_BH10PLA1_05860 [soil metagenome]
MHIDEIRSSPASRRLFLKRMSAAGMGVAAATLLAGGFSSHNFAMAESANAAATTPPSPTVPDVMAAFPGIPGKSTVEIVLNFALTLEILEADLYRQALNIASGRPIQTPLDTSPDKYKRDVKSGYGFNFAQGNAGFLYLAQFAFVEAAHRDFLIAGITAAGGTPTKPNPGGYKFPHVPSAGIAYIVGEILPLEETGVRAYLGALPYLGDQLAYAQVAGGIYSTEARHSAAIQYLFGNGAGPRPMPHGAGDMKVVPNYPSPNTFEYFLTPSQVLGAAIAYFA